MKHPLYIWLQVTLTLSDANMVHGIHRSLLSLHPEEQFPLFHLPFLCGAAEQAPGKILTLLTWQDLQTCAE